MKLDQSGKKMRQHVKPKDRDQAEKKVDNFFGEGDKGGQDMCAVRSLPPQLLLPIPRFFSKSFSDTCLLLPIFPRGICY